MRPLDAIAAFYETLTPAPAGAIAVSMSRRSIPADPKCSETAVRA
jgi:hypothetical protein